MMFLYKEKRPNEKFLGDNLLVLYSFSLEISGDIVKIKNNKDTKIDTSIKMIVLHHMSGCTRLRT